MEVIVFYYFKRVISFMGFPGGSEVKKKKKKKYAMQETWVRSLGQKDPLEKEIATHSSILA